MGLVSGVRGEGDTEEQEQAGDHGAWIPTPTCITHWAQMCAGSHCMPPGLTVVL